MNSRRPTSADPAEIDWHAFLQRPPLLATPSLEPFRDQSILITGAGGSIGSALSLRLASINARRLVLLDASEQALYRLQLHLPNAPSRSVVKVLGSVNEEALLDEICKQHQPQLVFHAAAHKHAPLLEEQPLAAIATNALGTRTLAACLRRHPRARLVLLSTDKAVDPANILGATKRVAERITLAFGGTVLRLANVLGSEGSVVEFFRQRILEGLPLPITDPRSTRLFVTSAETVDLLLTAATSTNRASLLIPSLDRAHSIQALAEFLSRTLAPGAPIEQTIIGLRPGDKLHEALVSADEVVSSGSGNGLLNVKFSSEDSNLATDLSRLADAVRYRNLTDAIELLCKIVPPYQPGAKIQQLISQSRTAVQSRSAVQSRPGVLAP